MKREERAKKGRGEEERREERNGREWRIWEGRKEKWKERRDETGSGVHHRGRKRLESVSPAT